MTAEELGLRVQQVLDRLTEAGQGEPAEELVRTLMEFYGTGLARVAAQLPAEALGDPLVAGLLTLHDLHPEDLPSRIDRALATVPGWRLHAFDPDGGRLTVGQDEGGGCGCDAGQVEQALACFAPEVTEVVVARRPVLLQIGTRPVAEVG
ncbi:thioredoxin [Kitasatospora sp. LaBMicrA B282]|uniref:thioredoxin n=1 Tax=Kitasatospora sp. LaBMicrA B282 TaxID=3420949 RepID=UPI003D113616